MVDGILKSAEQRMQKSIEALQVEFSRLRTGRAHAGLLDHITVSYYGNDTPLNQVASVHVSDPRTLSVTPWEKQLAQAIEKAIRESDLGLNPATSGTTVRVPIPPLTEERRKDLIRVVRNEAESARVAIRNIRRDANNQVKDMVKDKTISEDDERRAQERVQKLTDKYIKSVDELVSGKETDLLEV